MIDKVAPVERLIAKIKTEHSLAARMTPELMASLAKQTAAVAAPWRIMSLHYIGDHGRILCQPEQGPPIENAIYASTTHLRFDPRQPRTDDITAHQKNLVKHLGRK